jgi:hypothetical protein
MTQQHPRLIQYYTWVQPTTNDGGSSKVHGENESSLCKRKESEQEDEAELPCPFEYFEDGDEDPEYSTAIHRSGPLPKLNCFETPPEDLNVLEPLEYYKLGPEANPIRVLVLLPHFGNPYSTVQCNLFQVSLEEHHYCYAAITQTRGNKTLTSNIIINCQRLQITRNLEVFLRHFRKENHAQVIWVREICINQEDVSYHKTPEWRNWIFNNACRNLSMPDFMERLQEQGILEKEKQITIRQKAWSKVNRWDAPTHFPIPLRTFENVHLLTDETITAIPHEYVPLDLVAEEIRLVVLLPAKHRTDPLYAHFAHESIYGNVSYQCLSYTWGTGEAASELTLNGMKFPIRKSLEGALRSLRNEINKTTIWVDAICIDQQNVREKSRQVSRMHQIYENADCVLVWLGEADEDSDLALDFIASTNGYGSVDIFVDWEDSEAAVPQPFEYFEEVVEGNEDESTQILEASHLVSVTQGQKKKSQRMISEA